MPEPADAAARRQALDTSRSYIVQAPAGSGKTELLIQRFLALLGGVEHPESIVAITFTRKAATEMRSRVLAALEAAKGPEPEKEHEKQTWRLARAAAGRDSELGWRLRDSPSRLRIQTIDSLCSSLAGQMPWLSRLGGRPEVAEKAEPLYLQAARDTLALIDAGEEYTSAIERLLAHLDNNASLVEMLIVRMLGRRDQWLRHILGGKDKMDLRHELEAALSNVITRSLTKLRELIAPDAARELLGIARFAAGNLLASGGDNPVVRCADLRDLPGTEARDVPLWQGLAALMLAQDGARRKEKGLNKNLGFPPAKESLRSREWKSRHANLALGAETEVALHAVRSLPPSRFEDAQWEVLEALLVILRAAAANLRIVFQEQGTVDFIEVAAAARQALGSLEQPTALAYALDYRIRHLLIDEFQDTSVSQYELLLALTADWQPGDGRTVFLVGDPRQSIYRFRDANVGLFLEAWRSGVRNLPLSRLKLTVNFRSDAGIVDWVNRSLAGAFGGVGDPATGAMIYAPSTAFRPAAQDKPVRIHAFSHGDSDGEAAQVAEIVQQLSTTGKASTTAILVRARMHLMRIAARLREAGIRFQAIEIDALGEQPVVQDLLALTRALLHLGDRVSWLAILRSPWCGLSLADLHALASDNPKMTIWEALASRCERLSPDGEQRVARFSAVMEQSLARKGRMGLRSLMEGTWLALGGPACLQDRTSLEHAAAYFDLLESEEIAGELDDFDAFSDSVATLYAAHDVKAGPELQLMTIHKAKGLQFDNVILPGLDRTTRGGDSPLLRWDETLHPDGPAELLLAPINERGAADEPIYNYLKRVEAERGRHEDTRLLYVAGTRAKSRLFLLGRLKYDQETGELKEPDRRSLLAKIWPPVGMEFQAAFASQFQPNLAKVAAAESAAITLELRRLPAGWTMPEPPEAVAWHPADAVTETEPERPITFAWVGETARHIGTVVHALLQRIASDNGFRPTPALARAALASEGVSPDELDAAADLTLNAVRSTLEDEFGRWLLAPHGESRSEFALCGEVRGSIRHAIIDRTFVDGEGVRWIVDYKTSRHEGSNLDAFLDNEQRRYREQLETYAELTRRIDPRPVELCLYFPLLGAWRRWRFGGEDQYRAASTS